jgi:osmotically-inducible protein OsmY
LIWIKATVVEPTTVRLGSGQEGEVYMLDDSILQALVMEELDWEPSLDASHIGVGAKDGVVTLSGFVDSYAAKAAAERAAQRIQGVRAIAEELEVRLPTDHKHADAEIADRAVRILAWDILVPDERIRVKVEHGVVTLTGDVDHQFQRRQAETDIRRLGGVRSVVNLLRVAPPARATVDSDIVRQRIDDALRRSAEIEASRIQVRTDGHTVILRGQVRTWSERNAAEDAAWAAPGVTQVTNELRVQP